MIRNDRFDRFKGLMHWALAATYAAIISLMLAGTAAAQAVNDALDGLDTKTPLENWQVISAFVLPLVMAFIIQTGWSRGAQATATMLVSVLWTFVVKMLGDDTVIIPQFVVQALELFALSIPFYYGIWKPTGIAPKIEAATTLKAA